MSSPDEDSPATPEKAPAPEGEAAATPKKSSTRSRTSKTASKPEATPAPVKKPAPAEEKEAATDEAEEEEEEEGPRAPRRPTLSPETAHFLSLRQEGDSRRPRFVRQQYYRYQRLEQRGAWRRPRGLQSKQRRHYGYRPAIVRVGYRSPAVVRGRTPTGFIPVVVHNARELEAVDQKTEAAVLARTIGTRRRLVLEESARKRGVKVLNPVVKDEHEE